ncbi:MAG: MFS transporter [Chloroflexota bacterium]|nr:MFS transporter [Chloroflexota bacterium]
MTVLAAPPRPSVFAVFRKRNFTLLWIAQFISTMGGGLTAIAASILVYRVTGSALSVGLMLMATALPSLFVGLVAGVFVDRYDRKRIMVAAELLRALLIALIPLLLPFGIAWLYVIVTLSSAIAQFFNPAHASVLPEVASDEELAAANSFMTVSQIGALTVGYAGAGLIATLSSIAWAFYLDAMTFVVSALCIVLIQVPPLGVTDKTTIAAVTRNLRAGLTFVRATPALRSLFGETSDAAYFLLDGRTVASRNENGTDRVLEVHCPGDFFGEIVALASVPRTANVLTEQPTTILQVPAPALRRLMNDPDMSRIFFTKMAERMARMNMIDLPRFAGLDQASLRELRTPDSQPLPPSQPAPAI